MNEKHYEVIVVGGGISGAALFFELAKYSMQITFVYLKNMKILQL
jgi:L-2-hydroxyglutarate oxidase LhgO